MEVFYKKHMELSFAEFTVHSTAEQVYCRGELVKLEPQLYALLNLLLCERGKIVSRDRIEQEVWSGRPVTDEAIRAAIKKLRMILNDDARAPTFIKTIPKQGYKWLAPVREIDSSIDVAPKAGRWRSPLFVTCAILFAACCGVLAFTHSSNNSLLGQGSAVHSVSVEPLTVLPGSEVYADYHMATDKLAFLHRHSREEPQHLFVKHRATNKLERLSWDNANYANSRWSPSGSQLAFNRVTQTGINTYIADFTPQGSFDGARALNSPALLNKYVVDWRYNESALWLVDTPLEGKSGRVYRYEFESDTLTGFSSPNVTGQGDYHAAESHDGSKLAILREIDAQHGALLIIDIASGRMLANKTLPFMADQLMWQVDNNAVVVSSFFGQVSRYFIDTDYVDIGPPLPPNGLDIFASCGLRCYILRQHNGNFTDVQEHPINAETQLDAGRIVQLQGAQDFPSYHGNTDGLFFTSLQDGRLAVNYLSADHALTEVGIIPESFQLQALMPNTSGDVLAGIANGRLFTMAGKDAPQGAAQPKFITNALSTAANPSWNADGTGVYVAEYSAGESHIALYYTEDQRRESVIDKMTSFQLVPAAPMQAVATDANNFAWLLHYVDGKWRKLKKLHTLPSANPHRWHIVGNTVYYSMITDQQAYICAFVIERGDPESKHTCQSTGMNRFSLNFDIAPEQHKVLLVESLSAQSDIVRMTW